MEDGKLIDAGGIVKKYHADNECVIIQVGACFLGVVLVNVKDGAVNVNGKNRKGAGGVSQFAEEQREDAERAKQQVGQYRIAGVNKKVSGKAKKEKKNDNEIKQVNGLNPSPVQGWQAAVHSEMDDCAEYVLQKAGFNKYKKQAPVACRKVNRSILI
jgi:hypothetical protein